jgi:hypothetical protein
VNLSGTTDIGAPVSSSVCLSNEMGRFMPWYPELPAFNNVVTMWYPNNLQKILLEGYRKLQKVRSQHPLDMHHLLLTVALCKNGQSKRNSKFIITLTLLLPFAVLSGAFFSR